MVSLHDPKEARRAKNESAYTYTYTYTKVNPAP
jgi:hypothetical protein